MLQIKLNFSNQRKTFYLQKSDCKMYRNLLSIIIGLFSAFLIVLLLESLLPLLFGIQSLKEAGDPKAIEQYLITLPLGLLILLALTYGIAAFIGTYVSVLISNTPKSGLSTTAIFLIVVIVNFLSFHHPLWMVMLGSLGTLIGGFAGTKTRSKTIL